MLILHSHFPCMAAKALPVFAAGGGQCCLATSSQPCGSCCERSRAVVTPGTLTTLSWHATAHSCGSFQMPSQVLHFLVPLSEERLSSFLIHRLSQVLSKEDPACELLFLVI